MIQCLKVCSVVSLIDCRLTGGNQLRLILITGVNKDVNRRTND